VEWRFKNDKRNGRLGKRMANAKKIALVTGGNKGIGLELCRNLSKAGCTVLLGARNTERGQQAVRKLQEAGLNDVHFIELDVTKRDSVAAAAQQIESNYGRLDILLNNAGVNLRGDGPPGTADLDVVEKVFETNFFGALRVAQAMLPLLRKSPAGRIVNVSSGLGSLTFNSDPEWSGSSWKLIGYNGSKAAMNMMTVHLAHELRGTKVKVNSVNPGYTKTDLNANTGTQPVEVGAIEATRLALLDENGPTGGSFSKDGPDPW
jgi:NAD(P)-dependent dehydrogenase (short-subunit alcohol dehydrogenase family)